MKGISIGNSRNDPFTAYFPSASLHIPCIFVHFTSDHCCQVIARVSLGLYQRFLTGGHIHLQWTLPILAADITPFCCYEKNESILVSVLSVQGWQTVEKNYNAVTSTWCVSFCAPATFIPVVNIPLVCSYCSFRLYIFVLN